MVLDLFRFDTFNCGQSKGESVAFNHPSRACKSNQKSIANATLKEADEDVGQW
jgi:hypothetical protein